MDKYAPAVPPPTPEEEQALLNAQKDMASEQAAEKTGKVIVESHDAANETKQSVVAPGSIVGFATSSADSTATGVPDPLTLATVSSIPMAKEGKVLAVRVFS